MLCVPHQMSLYLFNELPASIWIPQDPDMLLLRQWLLNNDLATAENQLACVVLDRMNWDLFTEVSFPVCSRQLFLSLSDCLKQSVVI